MSTNLESPGRPLRRLPESAVPEGCPAWSGEHVRLWTGAQAPAWVPVRTRTLPLIAVALVGLIAGFWLADSRNVPPAVAALVPLQLMWMLVRPEIVRISAPLLTFLLAWYGGTHDPAVVVGFLAINATWAVVEFRLSAGRMQRRWAVGAAGGVTARVPDGVGPLRRGRFLIALGIGLVVLGAVFVFLVSGSETGVDRQEATLLGWFVVGWGLTSLLAGWLGRRRAAALRGAPVPVLRVLMRDGANGDVEVFAADDIAALRPLFTVSVEEWYADEDEDEDEEARRVRAEEMDALLDSIENDEQPGPLREAVLYGAPYDGGEIVIVSAPEDAEQPGGTDEDGDSTDEEIVVESSIGPVRALSERAVRLRIRAEKARARRAAAFADRRAAAAAMTAERLGSGAVRRWRAGWLDWAVCLLGMVWAAVLVLGEGGGWRYIPGAVIGLVGALMLPGMAAWRITADRDGLWLNGTLRTRHIAWDHLMTVKCEGAELKVDSRRARFSGAWTMYAPRWARLERRLGLIHPYERVAAELTAMWKNPDLRPTEASGEHERGRALWPLGVVLALVWVAALVLVP
ncbi:hypothetical protein Sipo8835_09180 [Streptomyces ipomoeae]|uniref:Uncharacterized protein n=1 Tax=Streptomyces ipomoeae TaxID=103232 RepID=A0AAE8W4S9_9ACTN|nr:hypothetical protein [Streptomyces ipomoeae]TQE36892.1 hypothetical protein Sipo8835_09180 [Streptomyces ipomoeae]TQE40369.1 hypothetical protein Sipo7851_00875 [Streptomyces ipomoeae]